MLGDTALFSDKKNRSFKIGMGIIQSRRIPAWVLLLTGTLLFIWSVYSLNVSGDSFTQGMLTTHMGTAENQQQVSLPFSDPYPSGVYAYTLQLSFKRNILSPTRLHIVPDDCATAIMVNGADVPLSSIPAADRCDYSKGFIIDLGHWLRSGNNTLVVDFRNAGGPAGIGVWYENEASLLWQKALFVISILLLIRPFRELIASQCIRKGLNKYGLSCCLLVMFLLLAALHFFALPKMIYKAEKFDQTGTESPILFPVFESKGAITIVHLDYQPLQQTRFQIFAHGCVRRIALNDIAVPFDGRQRCDITTGMTVNFAPFLKQGRNILTVETDTPGKLLQIGPLLFNPDHRQLADWIAFCLIGTACAGLVLFMHRQTGEALSGCLLMAGMLICLHRFSQTSFMEYTHDLWFHLQYITFIAHYGHWPKPYQYFHPPLYYTLEALLLLFVDWLGSFDTVSALRLFNLSCFIGFLVFAALTLRLLVRNQLAYYTALLLMVFYPSGLISPAQINNVMLFYTFYAGCLYFTLRWLETQNDRHLAFALALLGLGCATRTNMLMLVPLIGLAGIYLWRRRGWRVSSLRSKAVLAGLMVLAMGIGVNFGRTAYYNYAEHRHEDFIIGNFYPFPYLMVKDSMEKFLLLDTKAYFGQPFWHPWSDSSGRLYFWNALLKSSLFGEFSWQQGTIAKILSILLLGLIIYIGGNAITYWQDTKKHWKWWACAAALFLPVAAIMFTRWHYSSSGTDDFRYIYPVMIVFLGMFGMALEQYLVRRDYVLAGGGIFLAIVFATCSVLFFLTQ